MSQNSMNSDMSLLFGEADIDDMHALLGMSPEEMKRITEELTANPDPFSGNPHTPVVQSGSNNNNSQTGNYLCSTHLDIPVPGGVCLTGTLTNSPSLYSSNASNIHCQENVVQDVPVIIKREVPTPSVLAPAITNWSGIYDFNMLIENNANATWRYSTTAGKLFIGMDTVMSVKLNLDFDNIQNFAAYTIRAMPVFLGDNNVNLPVTRCPVHRSPEHSSNANFPYRTHFIRSTASTAIYEVDQNHRESVVVPLSPPQPGLESVTLLYKFMCLSSCGATICRRPLAVVFTLEKECEVLGRAVIQIRVCTSPKRDLRKEESKLIAIQPNDSATQLRNHANSSTSNQVTVLQSAQPVAHNQHFAIPTQQQHANVPLPNMYRNEPQVQGPAQQTDDCNEADDFIKLDTVWVPEEWYRLYVLNTYTFIKLEAEKCGLDPDAAVRQWMEKTSRASGENVHDILRAFNALP